MSFTTNYQVTNNLNAWQGAHDANIKEASENMDNPNLNQEDVLAQYFNKQEEIGTEFDFAQGKDATNADEYQEALDILGKGEVQSMDLDFDGNISREEYIANELSGVEDEFKQETAIAAYLMFDFIDETLGNDDESISSNEFARFYKNMDGFKLNENGEYELTQDFDGKFDIDSSTGFINFIMENVIDEEDIKATSDLLAKIPGYADKLSTLQNDFRGYIEGKIKASAN